MPSGQRDGQLTAHRVALSWRPCRLLERVAPERSSGGEAKRRIARATAETPFAPSVARVVDELIAAVAVTATAIAAS